MEKQNHSHFSSVKWRRNLHLCLKTVYCDAWRERHVCVQKMYFYLLQTGEQCLFQVGKQIFNLWLFVLLSCEETCISYASPSDLLNSKTERSRHKCFATAHVWIQPDGSVWENKLLGWVRHWEMSTYECFSLMNLRFALFVETATGSFFFLFLLIS